MSTQEPQTWGESLFLALRRIGGLPTALERLAPIIKDSPGYKAKTSYDRLTKMTERPESGSIEYARAWLLAVAAEANLEVLELSDDGLPPVFDPDQIRRALGQEVPKKRKKRGRPPSSSSGGLSIVL